LLLGRVPGVFREANRNCFLSASRLDVGLTRTMTRFTSEFFFCILRTSKRFPHDRVLEMLALIRVADNARIAAGIFAVGLSCRRRDCPCRPARAEKSKENHSGHK